MVSKNIQDIYPLSPMQRGMLFHSLYAPGTGVYVEELSCELRGHLNVDAFDSSWRRAVEHNPVLRTGFLWEGLDEPLQVVYRSVEFEIDFQDWRHQSPKEQISGLESLRNEGRGKGFDLSTPPLMRVALLRLGEERHRLIWHFHHLLLDGWSVPQLLQDVLTAYEAIRRGETPRLAARRPFRDYIGWLQQQDLSAAETFWRERLEGFSAPTTLPGDRVVRRGERDSGYYEQTILLPEDLSRTALAFAREQRVTLSSLVQAVWALQLSINAGEQDVVFGATVAGRPTELSNADEMVGLFINTLPVRVRLDPRATVGDWIRELQAQRTELRQYEYSFLVDVQGWSEVPRGQPLFESILVFQHYPVATSLEGSIGSLKLEHIEAEARTNYPLTLVVAPGEEITVVVAHDAARISTQDAKRIFAQFESLMATIVAHPEALLSHLPLLDQSERQRLVVDLNRTTAEFPDNRCVHELIADQARRRPEAIAVQFEDESFTYADLDGKANQLAHFLRDRGAAAEDIIAICTDRSFEMVVAILGALKAGCAYLPIDPDLPLERIAFMLSDSSARVVMTQSHLVETLPAATADVIRVDTDRSEIGYASTADPGIEVDPRQLAYVIYTSGSTGQPKGTLLQHRGLVNLCDALRRAWSVEDDSRVLQFASLSFDASVAEIFAALANGATLYVPRQGLVTSVPDLYQALKERSITIAALPPSVLAVLPSDGLDELRTLVSAGEQCSAELVGRWEKGRRFLNGYGPTEGTVAASMYECSADESEAPPIGGLIGNARAYVVDSYLRPLPVGVPGELCLGGVGLARGYLRRADLTAERFIPDPFSGDLGARLYRTGDLVRYREDGNLDFLGRIDHQVKLRGFRIELGEIEAVIRRQPGVRDAVVIAREDVLGDKRLVAYLVPDGELATGDGQLRRAVEEWLPSYMVPSAFVVLESFPLTSSGKVNRRALPAPEGARPDLETGYVAPRTPTEELMVGIWSDVLRVERVGVRDNFFELGGHSLLATQLASRIREAVKVEVPLKTLFESPTVEALARYIDGARSEGLASTIPSIERVSLEGDVPLSFAQERLWFLDQLEPNSSVYNIPTALRLTGQLDKSLLENSLRDIVRRHESLRTTFTSLDGRPIAVIADDVSSVLEVVDLNHLDDEEKEREAQRLALAQAREPFDLSTGPLLRVLLVRLDEREHLLFITIHHIIADGWSVAVLVREVASLYAAYAAGSASPLPDLPVRYSDFAHWQRRWLQGEVLQQQLDYWKDQLAGSAVLDLPSDRPRPAVPTHRGASERIVLSRELLDRLQRLSRSEGVTLFMTLLGAFQLLLSRYAGQEDVSVGTAIANRTHGQTEGLIGFFVNTLVMRTDLSGNPTFREVLRRVREVALGAYAHQDLPFEKIVEAIQPKRDMSHAPLFQVMFVLENLPVEGFDLPGLSVTAAESAGSGTATFDLTLSMAETPDGLHGEFEYSMDLFEAGTIRRMAGHLERLLEELVSVPESRVGEVEFLLGEERERLVRGWNETAVEYESGQCAHERFEARVRENPGAVAVRFEGEELSYGELDVRANQLGRYLKKLGVGRGDLVGLSVERGLEMVVGVLGTLKAGAAYVPVDPSYPAERVAYMLEDSGAGVVLTQSHLVEGLPLGGARAVCLDGEWEEIAKEEGSKPEVEVGPGDVAYVIYTSGSTGRPKGTVLSHGGLVNLSEAQREAFGIGEGSRVLQFAPLSFDASVWETVMALGNGGTLSVMRQEVLASVTELGEALRAEGVTTVTLPPSVLGVLESESLPELRTVVAAGEACSLELVRRWSVGGRAFFNAYGPTETTVCASMYRCRGDEEEAPPIGRPLANLRLYVLDGHGRLVPEGVPGELCVGGVGVAQGYLRRPELTAEKFIPDGYSGEVGSRLYRTGDLVRYGRDGNLEFLGRIDHQVKLRGFRIELGEIEAILREQPGVSEAVALAREDTPGDQRLVAYVLREPGAELQANELRAAMRQNVAEYMVPSFFVVLDEFPLTPSGKIDRPALPPPEGRAAVQAEYVAPRNEIERVLVEVCSEVLAVEKVGVFDDFFELGGHSLLATQFMSRVQNRLGVEVPLRALFEHSHVASLAEVVEALLQEPATPEAPAIVPLARERRRMKRSELSGVKVKETMMSGENPETVSSLEHDT